MFLVAVALAFAALGTWIGRDLEVGTARILSFAGFGMLLVSSFGGERFRSARSRWAGCSRRRS